MRLRSGAASLVLLTWATLGSAAMAQQTVQEINAERERIEAQTALTNAQTALHNAQSAESAAEQAAEAAAARVSLGVGRATAQADLLEAQKRSADAAAAAIGTGYRTDAPPTISADALQSAYLMLRGEGVERTARALYDDVSRSIPSGKTVLLISGTQSIELSVWNQMSSDMTMLSATLQNAFEAATRVQPQRPRSQAFGIDDIAALGTTVRAVDSLLNYARTQYSFVGSVEDTPAADMAAAEARMLVTSGRVVILPTLATPVTEDEANDVFVRIRTLARRAVDARAYAAELLRSADDEHRAAEAAQGDAKKPHVDKEAGLRGAADGLTSAAAAVDRFVAGLQPSADGRQGIGVAVSQWRIAQLLARADYALVLTSRTAYAGRSKRSLWSAIFGPPVDVAVAVSVTHNLFDRSRTLISAGMNRVYVGPRAWSAIATDGITTTMPRFDRQPASPAATAHAVPAPTSPIGSHSGDH